MWHVLNTHRTSVRSLSIKTIYNTLTPDPKLLPLSTNKTKLIFQKSIVSSSEFRIFEPSAVQTGQSNAGWRGTLEIAVKYVVGYKKGAKRLKGLCEARECQVFTELCPYSLFVHVPFPMWLSGGFCVINFGKNRRRSTNMKYWLHCWILCMLHCFAFWNLYGTSKN